MNRSGNDQDNNQSGFVLNPMNKIRIMNLGSIHSEPEYEKRNNVNYNTVMKESRDDLKSVRIKSLIPLPNTGS